MRPTILYFVALAVALSVFGQTALARPGGGAGGAATGGSTAKPARTDVTLPSEWLLKGLTEPVGEGGNTLRPHHDGRPGKAASGQERGRGPATATAGTARWFDGNSSNTYFTSPVSGIRGWLTTEWVGYWATEDGSYPNTGELYYAHVVIGNVGAIGPR